MIGVLVSVGLALTLAVVSGYKWYKLLSKLNADLDKFDEEKDEG